MAEVIVEIPDDILSEFGENEAARSQFALEAMAVEAYRQERLGTRRLARLLGTHHTAFLDFLGQRQIPGNLTGEELIQAYHASRRFLRS